MAQFTVELLYDRNLAGCRFDLVGLAADCQACGSHLTSLWTGNLAACLHRHAAACHPPPATRGEP